jgi:hypothetical protein
MNSNTLSIQEKIHYTNLWCRELGIKNVDLGCVFRIDEDGKTYREVKPHPQIDDVILLVQFLKEYLDELPDSKRVHLHIMWNWVYTCKKPLTKKYLKQLNRLTTQLNNIRYNKNKRLAQARKKIKALRQNPTIAR